MKFRLILQGSLSRPRFIAVRFSVLSSVNGNLPCRPLSRGI